MSFIIELLTYVVQTLLHNAPYLFLGILIAAIIQVYVDPERFKTAILKRANVSIPGSVAFGAFTPFCACGTMAVVVAMLTTALPWGPIMAFLTSSPLMSPDEFVMISGIVSLKFAIALTVASVFIGLGSGYISHFIEKKSNFLTDQIRFQAKGQAESCGCDSRPERQEACYCEAETDDSIIKVNSCCSATPIPHVNQNTNLNWFQKIKWRELLDSLLNVGVKQILLYFTFFAAIGYLINHFVPSSIITGLFNAKNIFAVPLAAVIGLPLYVTGASSIPLIKSLMAGGASGGAMLAFMITGPGTSAGVIAGIGTIMKKRAILLYTSFLLVGAILLGYLYDAFLVIGK